MSAPMDVATVPPCFVSRGCNIEQPEGVLHLALFLAKAPGSMINDPRSPTRPGRLEAGRQTGRQTAGRQHTGQRPNRPNRILQPVKISVLFFWFAVRPHLAAILHCSLVWFPLSFELRVPPSSSSKLPPLPPHHTPTTPYPPHHSPKDRPSTASPMFGSRS
jgi:hypothetical protein